MQVVQNLAYFRGRQKQKLYIYSTSNDKNDMLDITKGGLDLRFLWMDMQLALSGGLQVFFVT